MYSVERKPDFKKGSLVERGFLVPGKTLFLHVPHEKMADLGTLIELETKTSAPQILLCPCLQIYERDKIVLGGVTLPRMELLNRQGGHRQWVSAEFYRLLIAGDTLKDIHDALRDPEIGRGLGTYLGAVSFLSSLGDPVS